MSKARELAELSRTVSDSADATAITINSSEEVTFADDIFLADGKKVVLGDDNDLEIFHTGGASVIADSGSGSLFIQGESQIVLGNVGNIESYAIFNTDGAVQLRHNNAQKFTTTSTGIDISGTASADDVHVPSSGAYEVGGSTSSTTAIGSLSNSAGKLTLDTDSTRSIHLKTGGTVRQFIDGGTGDISFLDGSGNAAVYFDSSAAALGIGTSLPGRLVEVKGTSNPAIRLNNNTDNADIGLATSGGALLNGSSSGDLVIARNGANGIVMGTNGLTRLKVASGGGVEVTTSGVAMKAPLIQPTNGNVASYTGTTPSMHSPASATLAFSMGGGERMRISGGNLLVGTTDTVPSNNGAGGDAGVAISPDGVFRAARSGNVSLDINRMDSDGDIAAFRKDGTTVGSIQSRAGLVSTIILDPRSGSLGTGITGSGANLSPTNGSGTEVDARNDIGTSTYRFKDLYLSGGIFLGGTGSANELSDYEEGTWTMGLTTSNGNSNISNTNSIGYYTKVGNLVTVGIYNAGANVIAAGTGYPLITGLPFPVASGNGYYTAATFAHTNIFSGTYSGYASIGTSQITIVQVGSIGAASFATGNDKYLMIGLTYFTSA